MTGKGCHASTPHLGKNPNLIAANIILVFRRLISTIKRKNPFIVIHNNFYYITKVPIM
ncbi:MAG: peptidase dimerization domain-containing protein [Christensenellales bacterium]